MGLALSMGWVGGANAMGLAQNGPGKMTAQLLGQFRSKIRMVNEFWSMGTLEIFPIQTVHVRTDEDFDSKFFTNTCNATAPFCKYSIS